MKSPLNFLLIIIFVLGCSKDNLESANLAEIIIGEWKLKELVEPGTFGDAKWHGFQDPATGIVFFNKDSTVVLDYNSFAEELGTYHVIENDTIYFTINWDFIWTVIDFNESELTVSLGTSPEGETKRRYTKIN